MLTQGCGPPFCPGARVPPGSSGGFPSGTPPTPSGAPCPCSMLSMPEDGVQNQTKTSQYIQFLKNQNVKTFKRGVVVYRGFPGGSDGEESACNAGDPSLIPESEDPLKKKMATHSSILTWRIPRAQDSGGLQSTGSQESDPTS